jgi:hypothetical protein
VSEQLTTAPNQTLDIKKSVPHPVPTRTLIEH